jgi:tRNA threonylcarbamoyl adenosine modification protein YeaZ
MRNKILSIETCFKSCSVAFFENGMLAHYAEILEPNRQAEMILSLIKQVAPDLREVDFIAVNNGPGSFTGIRIGVACVEGLRLGLPHLKLINVSTLEALSTDFDRLDGFISVPFVIGGQKSFYVQEFSRGLSTGTVSISNAPIGIIIETTPDAKKLGKYAFLRLNLNPEIPQNEFVEINYTRTADYVKIKA